MNFTKLDSFFNSVFAKQSASGKAKLTQEITLEGRSYNGVYTLTCIISGEGVTTSRTKSAGTNAPAEKPWDMEAVNAYYLAKMDNVYNALPADTQAAFATEYVAVKDFVKRGKSDVAKKIVENTPVTSDLEATKAALLALL